MILVRALEEALQVILLRDELRVSIAENHVAAVGPVVVAGIRIVLIGATRISSRIVPVVCVVDQPDIRGTANRALEVVFEEGLEMIGATIIFLALYDMAIDCNLIREQKFI